MWPVLLVASVVVPPLFARVLAVRPRPARVAGALACMAAALGLPLVVPADLHEMRAFIGAPALAFAIKLVDVARGRPVDPAMWRGLPRFLVWYFVPADTRAVPDPEARVRLRRNGGLRLARAALKGLGFLALLTVSTLFPGMHDRPYVTVFWGLWALWLGISGVTDAIAAPALLGGFEVEEIFRAPPLSRSPGDLWGRRWNMVFRNFAFRQVFAPLGVRGHPILAVCAVFALSAVVHEYMVLASLGATRGHMSAFFLLQGLATLTELALPSRARRRLVERAWLAVPLHMGWLTLTAPLFFVPLLEMVPFHTWRLW